MSLFKKSQERCDHVWFVVEVCPWVVQTLNKSRGVLEYQIRHEENKGVENPQGRVCIKCGKIEDEISYAFTMIEKRWEDEERAKEIWEEYKNGV